MEWTWTLLLEQRHSKQQWSKVMSLPDSATITTSILTVKRLLGPLTASEVPIIRCVCLNYMRHIREVGRTPPPHPSMFIKPSECVADRDSVVHVPKLAQDEQCDYEDELVSRGLSRSHTRLTKSRPDHSHMERWKNHRKGRYYVAGYIAGNDFSARKWQRDPAYAGGVPKWCFSKGFDNYAPLGPWVVSTAILGDASNLRLVTLINGEVRQDTSMSDLLFGVRSLISFLSQSTTFGKGF
jgi:2-keto-4-pentenoate hydratase/2-oxohepta-3-ene-1,7-dioic acid hydratase in catechol pathway